MKDTEQAKLLANLRATWDRASPLQDGVVITTPQIGKPSRILFVPPMRAENLTAKGLDALRRDFFTGVPGITRIRKDDPNA